MNRQLIFLLVLVAGLTGCSRVDTAQNNRSIEEMIAGKFASERADIKGREIAKIDTVSRTKRGGYDIEIVSMKAIVGGVEVFARAWDAKGNQIGFGRDGTVDIERFRIFNPPILVDDPAGTVERTIVNERTLETTIRLRN